MPCPLIDVADVDAAFERAGVDASLEQWWLAVEGTAGITCVGSHVGFEDDPSFPQLEVEITVADTGSATGDEAETTDEPIAVTGLPGGTVGTCEADRFVTICEEHWSQDGFDVGLLVSDRVYFDRVTASTVLGDVVPTIVANLADASTDVADPLGAVTGADVSAAATGVDRFVDANPDAVESDGERLACPAISGGEVESALDAVGIELDLADDWSASLTPVTFPADLDPIPIRLTCTGGADPTARVDVIDFVDASAADEFVASVGLAEGGSPADLEPGDLTVGTCTNQSGLRFCTEWWRLDGLVVGVWLIGDSQQIGEQDAAALLVDVLPDVLANLSEYS